MSKGFVPVLLVIVLAIAGLAGVVYVKESGKVETFVPLTEKACTLEEKLCPDGSSVGRGGPNCEFNACPSIVPIFNDEKIVTLSNGIKKYSNNRCGDTHVVAPFEIQIPEGWNIKQSASEELSSFTRYNLLASDKVQWLELSCGDGYGGGGCIEGGGKIKTFNIDGNSTVSGCIKQNGNFVDVRLMYYDTPMATYSFTGMLLESTLTQVVSTFKVSK